MIDGVCMQRGELPLDRARSPQLRSLLHSAAQGSNGPVTTDEDKSDRSAAESDDDDDDGLFSPASGSSHHACNAQPNAGSGSSNGNSNGTSSSSKAATETRPVVNGDANGAHNGAHPHSRRHELIGKKHSFYKWWTTALFLLPPSAISTLVRRCCCSNLYSNSYVYSKCFEYIASLAFPFPILVCSFKSDALVSGYPSSCNAECDLIQLIAYDVFNDLFIHIFIHVLYLGAHKYYTVC